jgi:8-oxo-dGTP diphosphatase
MGETTQPLKTTVTVTAAVLVKDGKILIARRGRGDRLAGKWEFPGGKLEADESPAACLKRELKEEFNIDVAVGEFLGSGIHHYPHLSINLHVFRAYWTGGRLTVNAHAEHRWVGVTELPRFDFSPADVPFVEKLRNGEFDPLSE